VTTLCQAVSKSHCAQQQSSGSARRSLEPAGGHNHNRNGLETGDGKASAAAGRTESSRLLEI